MNNKRDNVHQEEGNTRVNRFSLSNRHLDMYGGSQFRRSLESAERKHRVKIRRAVSENRFGSQGHMMPRPLPHKM